jgi:putative endonuclease
LIPQAHRTGRLGEQLAADYLEAHGYHILVRNYRHGKAEIDIIALKGNCCCVVEVKTRGVQSLVPPQDTVSAGKRKLLMRAAGAFIDSFQQDADVRFDIIAIQKGRNQFNIRHLKNAFDCF